MNPRITAFKMEDTNPELHNKITDLFSCMSWGFVLEGKGL